MKFKGVLFIIFAILLFYLSLTSCTNNNMNDSDDTIISIDSAYKYLKLGKQYQNSNQFSLSHISYKKAMILFSHFEIDSMLSNTYIELALLECARGNEQIAFNYYKDAIIIAKSINDKYLLYSCYHDYACALIDNCRFSKGLALAFRALALIDYSKNASTSNVNNVIGNAYLGLFKYEEALLYYNEAIKFASSTSQIITVNNGIANALMGLEKYDGAKKILQNNVDISAYLNDPINYSIALCNLAELFYKIGNMELSANYHTKSLDASIECNDNYGIALAYYNLGNIYFATDRLDSSEFMLSKSIEYCNKLNNVELENKCWLLLSELYSKNNQGANVENALRKIIDIQEKEILSESEFSMINSINNYHNSIECSNLQYAIDKQNKIISNLKYSISLIILFLIIVLLLFTIAYLQKQKKSFEEGTIRNNKSSFLRISKISGILKENIRN